MDTDAECFYSGESVSTKLKLPSFNATQRRIVFDEVLSTGYVDDRISRITATSLLWNPDTAYLFEVRSVCVEA